MMRASQNAGGLLKMLKKVRHYLYGVRFVVEMDAKTPCCSTQPECQ
jgi:hypothetical protein